METLLNELPVKTLGYPLNSFWKVFTYFLLPSFSALCVYVLLICSDFALVYAHISVDNPRWGTVTILFMFFPSIAGCIFTLSSPNRWPSSEPFTKENFRFLALNLWHLFFFPFAAIYRYIHQIFWSVEAMCAEHFHDFDRRENALRILLKPNSMEMYFFLQAYLHSAPQIFLQFFTLFRETNEYREIASLQIMSIVCSLFRMAVTTMGYQRFQRRKVLGAYYPWTSKKMLSISNRWSAVESSQYQESVSEVVSNYEPPLTGIRPLPIIEEAYLQSEDEETEKKNFSASDYLGTAKSSNSTLFEEPADSKENVLGSNHSITDYIGTEKSSNSTLFEEPVEQNKRVTIIESPVTMRKNPFDQDSLQDKVVDMSKHVTPPSSQAPRPMSIAAIKERIVNNANAFVEQIPKRRYKDYDEIDLPVQRRRTVVKGVEQEDGVSKFVAFVAWLLFISARMLVLCTFSFFYMEAFIYICLTHYLLATGLLMWNSWSESLYRKFFYLFLGYIYIFCLIELKMTFRKVRIWYGGFFSVVSVENFILTTIWFSTGDVENWWFKYILFITVLCNMMSFVCFLIYFMILKPRPVIVYRPPSNNSEFYTTSSLIQRND